jgi:hypothetical protein
MTLPVEYQNLINRRSLEVVAPTPGAVAAFLQQAENYLASAKQIDPKLSMQVVIRAHERRNGTSYPSPFPPISRPEAMALVHILEKYIPVAYQILGAQRPASKG